MDQLESKPDLNLEEALELYDRGAVLARRCRSLLSEATLRVNQLSAESHGEDQGEHSPPAR